MSSFNRGSEWRKWDLQIQPIKGEWWADINKKKKEIKLATNEYLKMAIDKQIDVIAITDHNCGHAIDAAFELIEANTLNLTVFPGVEIDLNLGFQIIIVFNPEYKIKIKKHSWVETVEHFLNNVCSIESPVINTYHQAKATSRDINELLGIICKEDIGIPIFAHVQNDKGLFKKTSAANRKEFFDNIIAKKYYSAFDHKTDDEIDRTRKILEGWDISPNIFSLLKTSDAHHASETGNVFTWIKSNPTYEGLKQIIYDPQSRISIQGQKPVQPNNVIESITFNIPDSTTITVKQNDGSSKDEKFCFAGVNNTYYLSPYFNCFIGGRGSGKSTILNFLGQYSKEPSSSQTFWKKIQPSFDTMDTNIFSFDGVELFEFIGQSEVENFATNTETFTIAIYERANILNEKVLDIDEKKLSIHLTKINSFQSLISDLNELITEQNSKEKDRKMFESSIKITESNKYTTTVQQITEKSNEKQRLEKWRTKIDELRKSLNNLQKQYFLEKEETVPEVEQKEKEITQLYKDAFEKVKENIESAIKTLLENNFKDLMTKEENLSKEIVDHEEELSKLLKSAGLSDENIIQAKSAPQMLVKLEDELSKIKEKIGNKNKELNTYDNIIGEAKKVKKEFEEAIINAINPLVTILGEQAVQNNSTDIKNIVLNYFFDEEQAWEDIANDFYNYFMEIHGDGERSDYLKDYIISRKDIFSSDHIAIKELLSNEESSAGYIKFLKEVFNSYSNFQIYLTIRDKHLNDVNKYKRIKVLYDGKDIERASFGQKCTAVMVILLLFGNYPLIIDEPEAHLDSSLIANYLVPLIKRKKINRQIIFATHNANFVINGDAEKIFILKNETGTTEVIETTIEDLENRNELLKLEGGKEAFRKRGEKLNI